MELPLPVRRKIQDLIRARDALESAIMAAMDTEAARLELDEFIVTHFGNSPMKDGEEVEAPLLEALDDCYLEHVHAGGFEACWDSEEGWC